MALTAAQYQTEAEAALTTAKSKANLASNDNSVAYSQIASVYAFLFVEKSKLDAAV